MRWQSTLVLLVAILPAMAAFAQTQPPADKSASEGNSDLLLSSKDIEKNISANAKPYVDYPLPELEAAVPELNGLEPSTSQESLGSLLDRAGEKCVDLSRRTPNVVSQEEVITLQWIPKVISRGEASPQVTRPKPQRQKFEYLLLSHRTSSGVELVEYRTSKGGRGTGKADTAADGQLTQGFVNEWLRLYPGNRSESRFRYLGQQEMDKHKTFVLAFAEIPKLVKFPAQFLFSGTRVSVLLQGVVWIDSSDFRIVRMHEDLLAPRPDIYLEKLSTKILFDEVHIPKAEASLWLPKEVAIEWEFNGRVVRRRHLYSNYRLYAVKTKILPTSP